eukprot:364951-Chlamydomonas_euryale.AAC.10
MSALQAGRARGHDGGSPGHEHPERSRRRAKEQAAAKAVSRENVCVWVDGSIRTFCIYHAYGLYGIYGRPLEAMYGTRTRMSALEGCLAALRCGASAQCPPLVLDAYMAPADIHL